MKKWKSNSKSDFCEQKLPIFGNKFGVNVSENPYGHWFTVRQILLWIELSSVFVNTLFIEEKIIAHKFYDIRFFMACFPIPKNQKKTIPRQIKKNENLSKHTKIIQFTHLFSSRSVNVKIEMFWYVLMVYIELTLYLRPFGCR